MMHGQKNIKLGTYIYITPITYINPTNYEVRRDLVPQIFTTPSV